MKELTTPREVMEAFLAGKKLVNSQYGFLPPDQRDPELYLYLSPSGQICEEDGAGAKANRVPILMRNEERWFSVDSNVELCPHCKKGLRRKTPMVDSKTHEPIGTWWRCDCCLVEDKA